MTNKKPSKKPHAPQAPEPTEEQKLAEGARLKKINTAEKEFGGFGDDSALPEPTRYTDWEVKGRCSDF